MFGHRWAAAEATLVAVDLRPGYPPTSVLPCVHTVIADVAPVDGSPPFRAEFKAKLIPVNRPAVGDRVRVRYDAKHKVRFDFREDPQFDDFGTRPDTSAERHRQLMAAPPGTPPPGSPTGGPTRAVVGSSIADLLQKGVRAWATVTAASPLGITAAQAGDADPRTAGDPVSLVEMALTTADGSTQRSRTGTRVPAAKVTSLYPGAVMAVAYDPRDPVNEVAIDWAMSPMGS